MAKWTLEDKQRALAIAEASSTLEAERETGIPAATIRSWRSRMTKSVATDDSNATTQRNTTPKKIQQLTEQAIEEAKEEVKDYVAGRVKQTADNILNLVELAVRAAGDTIREGAKEDEPNAAWLRALVGAMGQGVEKYQLFTGQPTSRNAVEGQVNQTYEYRVEQIIQTDPESQRLIESLYERSLTTTIPDLSED